jgi:hypothetical protein
MRFARAEDQRAPVLDDVLLDGDGRWAEHSNAGSVAGFAD